MMRHLFLPFLLLSGLVLSAQDCKLNRENDAYTKETKLSTGFLFVSGGSLTIDADKREIIVLFNVEGPERCFDDNSTVELFFENIKSKNLMRNGGTMNCEGLFQLVFRNNQSPPSLLQKLMTQKLTQLAFTTTANKRIVLDVDEGQREAIRRMADCLYKEARTLQAP